MIILQMGIQLSDEGGACSSTCATCHVDMIEEPICGLFMTAEPT